MRQSYYKWVIGAELIPICRSPIYINQSLPVQVQWGGAAARDDHQKLSHILIIISPAADNQRQGMGGGV